MASVCLKTIVRTIANYNSLCAPPFILKVTGKNSRNYDQKFNCIAFFNINFNL